jgi:hypothetical protein
MFNVYNHLMSSKWIQANRDFLCSGADLRYSTPCNCLQPFRASPSEHFPCGRCSLCRKRYASDWATRASLEHSEHDTSLFFTLTYADPHLPENRSVKIDDVQRFIKRLRYFLSKDARNFRYIAAGEYGDKRSRPHYHFVGFGLHPHDLPLLKKAWSFGTIDIGTVTSASISYVMKYSTKRVVLRADRQLYKDTFGIEPPFFLMSRRPGIGFAAAIKRRVEFLENQFILFKGRKRPIPLAVRRKLELPSMVEAMQRFHMEQMAKLKKTSSQYLFSLREQVVQRALDLSYAMEIKRFSP